MRLLQTKSNTCMPTNTYSAVLVYPPNTQGIAHGPTIHETHQTHTNCRGRNCNLSCSQTLCATSSKNKSICVDSSKTVLCCITLGYFWNYILYWNIVFTGHPYNLYLNAIVRWNQKHMKLSRMNAPHIKSCTHALTTLVMQYTCNHYTSKLAHMNQLDTRSNICILSNTYTATHVYPLHIQGRMHDPTTH